MWSPASTVSCFSHASHANQPCTTCHSDADPGSIELHHAALALDRRRIEEARRYLEQHAAMLQPMIDEDEGIRTQLALWIVGHYGRGLFEWARLATAENRWADLLLQYLQNRQTHKLV